MIIKKFSVWHCGLISSASPRLFKKYVTNHEHGIVDKIVSSSILSSRLSINGTHRAMSMKSKYVMVQR